VFDSLAIQEFLLPDVTNTHLIPHSTVAPPNLRGVLGTMTQFFLTIGILFADVVGFALANAARWRWMFALTSGMALIQLLLTPLLLESPRWLLMKSPNSIKARFVIKKLRGFRYDEEVETEVEHYVRVHVEFSCFSLRSIASLTNIPCFRLHRVVGCLEIAIFGYWKKRLRYQEKEPGGRNVCG
jgi:hypothetical protein